MKIKMCLIALIFSMAGPIWAQSVFNFDVSSSVDIKDLVYFISWLQAEQTGSVEVVVARAKEIFPEASGPLTRLPSLAYEDINDDGLVDVKDLVLFIAWLQAEQTSVFSVVENRALEIYSTVGRLSKLPGTPIGDSKVPITITGIQVDPSN